MHGIDMTQVATAAVVALITGLIGWFKVAAEKRKLPPKAQAVVDALGEERITVILNEAAAVAAEAKSHGYEAARNYAVREFNRTLEVKGQCAAENLVRMAVEYGLARFIKKTI
jgi:hypothetical protein